MLEYMWIIWLAVFLLALVIEGISSEIVSIWFALGALIALLASLIPGVEWWIQLILFVVISVATLFALRPMMMKFMKKNQVQSNVDTMIGKHGKMRKECDEFNHGEVKIDGIIWTAIAADEKTSITEGTIVEVVSIDGNKLIVKPLKAERN